MVRLSDIVDALSAGNGFSTYYDRQKDKVVFLSEYDNLEEDSELRELIEEDESDRFLCISNPYGCGDDWEDLMDFIQTIEDEEIRNRFFDKVTGRGAFRTFRILLDIHDLEEQWYAFKNARTVRSAREWCENHSVKFTE